MPQMGKEGEWLNLQFPVGCNLRFEKAAYLNIFYDIVGPAAKDKHFFIYIFHLEIMETSGGATLTSER